MTRRLHRPLAALTALMAVTAIGSAALALVAPVEILGANGWLKPLKFSISIGVFAATIALILDTLPRRRWSWWLGTVIAALLLIEQAIIVAAVAQGSTSHFNVATTLAGTLYSVMGVSIAVVWMLTLVLAVLVWRRRDGDPARRAALRAGIVVGLVGMGLAFLMTSPTSAQLSDFRGVAGAHAVGVDDGGAGLPLLGWSTEGGDLRVPHFIGMHALQVLPLLVLSLELLARRVPMLGSTMTRARLAWIAGAAWAGVTAITTWQALRGESIVAPSTPVAVTTALLCAGTLFVTAAVLRSSRTRVAEHRAPLPMR